MGGRVFLEAIRSEGLAHISYLLGHGNRAAVIDPRRDCRVYLERAASHGARITHIFETHRNEDYVVGSRELADLTGASIFHGHALDFPCGTPVWEKDAFEVGDLLLTVLETPGHTDESISIVLFDTSFGDAPVGVFTGDVLFVGDVGRTDFYPHRAEEVAALLHASIFEKLLPLGDHVILYPAHGAGSVCGGGMAAREFSTLGYERRNNPALQDHDREEFVQRKLKEHHDKPPYFSKMEDYNLRGNASFLRDLGALRPMDADRFGERLETGMHCLDLRDPEAMGGALIPGSLGIPLDMVPSFAGWFLDDDAEIGLVLHDRRDAETAKAYLARLGYDNVAGYLEDGLFAWEVTGRPYESIPSVHAAELTRMIREKRDFTLLDVRTRAEFKESRLPGAVNIFVGELPGRLDEIPKDRPVLTFCGSGLRAIIGATILKKNGFAEVENCLGSMAACAASGCPIEKGRG